MKPCHQCQKPHDRATNNNIYCVECTGEDSFQCEDCTEKFKRSEIGFVQKCEPFTKLWCKACCEKPEVDEWDGEPVTRTEYWDNYQD